MSCHKLGRAIFLLPIFRQQGGCCTALAILHTAMADVEAVAEFADIDDQAARAAFGAGRATRPLGIAGCSVTAFAPTDGLTIACFHSSQKRPCHSQASQRWPSAS